jgi:hypothetical protein
LLASEQQHEHEHEQHKGQGLVYGFTVILAFTECEGRLAALQVGWQ